MFLSSARRQAGRLRERGNATFPFAMWKFGSHGMLATARGVRYGTVHRARRGVMAGLLGKQWLSVAQTIATETNIPLQGAATQVWALKESLRKCGASFDQHLQISTQTADGWTILSSGKLQAATCQLSIQGFEGEVAFAFVTQQAP